MPKLPLTRAFGATSPRKRGEVGVCLALVALLTFIGIIAALALDFPALTGRVVDDANIIDTATRAVLTQKLADLEAKTTDQLVVVTLKSLQGTSIEDFGVQLARHWQIGQQGKNNGVLLIVVPSERRVRIEIGYGLEGTLTDAVSRLIIENAIIPRFRANDFPGGIVRGVDDIIDVLTGDPEEWKRRAAKRPEGPDWLAILAVLWVLGISIVVLTAILRDIFSRPDPQHARTGRASRSSDSSSPTSWSTGSSGSSWGDSSGGFSGGGGSFGGGGASGSW